MLLKDLLPYKIIYNNELGYEELRKQTGFIAGITAYPGEDELLALAQGALRVLTKEEEAKEYWLSI